MEEKNYKELYSGYHGCCTRKLEILHESTNETISIDFDFLFFIAIRTFWMRKINKNKVLPVFFRLDDCSFLCAHERSHQEVSMKIPMEISIISKEGDFSIGIAKHF